MHRDFQRADAWTSAVIAAAIEVHRLKGPGLLESICERCLLREFELRGVPVASRVQVPIEYKGLIFEETLRLDVCVDHCPIVEVKAAEAVLPIHEAQLRSCMRLLDAPSGLLIDFREVLPKDGIRKMLLPGANLVDGTSNSLSSFPFVPRGLG